LLGSRLVRRLKIGLDVIEAKDCVGTDEHAEIIGEMDERSTCQDSGLGWGLFRPHGGSPEKGVWKGGILVEEDITP